MVVDITTAIFGIGLSTMAAVWIAGWMLSARDDRSHRERRPRAGNVERLTR